MQNQGTPYSYFEMIDFYVPWQETLLLNLLFLIACLNAIALLHATLLRFTKPQGHDFRRSHRASIFCSLLVILLLIAKVGYFIFDTCTKVMEAGGAIDPAYVMAGFYPVGVALVWMAGAGAALLLALLLHWSRPDLQSDH